jgi:hypothetical protein
MRDVVSEVVDLIQTAYPQKWVIVPPERGDAHLVIYTKEMEAIIDMTAPATFVILSRTTGQPVTWGEADCASDALVIVVEWLTFSSEMRDAA